MGYLQLHYTLTSTSPLKELLRDSTHSILLNLPLMKDMTDTCKKRGKKKLLTTYVATNIIFILLKLHCPKTNPLINEKSTILKQNNA